MAMQAPAFATTSKTPSITIAASSKFKPVTGDVFVGYKDGTAATAKLSGRLAGAATGEVVRLSAERFKSSKFKPAGSVTLTAKAHGAYSFSVTPTLATTYQVALFANASATTPLATSATKTVYVVLIQQASPQTRPVCGKTGSCTWKETLKTKVPSHAMATEAGKTVYPYFGLSLARSRPARPRTLYLNGGKLGRASVSKITVVKSHSEYTFTITVTFGNKKMAAYPLLNECTKGTESTDGVNLPGSHGCGARSVPSSATYLG